MAKSKKLSFRKNKFGINTYGYGYSTKDLLLTGFIFICGMIWICFLHKMTPIYMSVVLITMLIAIPIMITSFFFYKREKQRFEDFCKYYEYMKLYYKSKRKIKLALEETSAVFDDKSNMKKCIESALHEINTTGDYKKALDYIDAEYHTSYLDRFHHLLIIGEQHGSETVIAGINGIYYETWKEDIKMYQKKKDGMRKALYGFTALAYLGSYFTIWLFAGNYFNLASNATFQLYTFLDVEGILLVAIYVYVNIVNKKWIRSDD